MKKTLDIKKLVESSVMIALAIVLNLVVLWQAPLGGKWTLCSMPPIMLIAIKNGLGWGLGTSFVYSVIQLGFSIAKVLSWGLTPGVLIGCLLFDYIIPYTVLGLAALPTRKKKTAVRALAGIALAIALRFVSHFISGTIFFGNWDDGFWSVIVYSILYNGQYLLPELALTLAVSVPLVSIPIMRKTIGIESK